MGERLAGALMRLTWQVGLRRIGGGAGAGLAGRCRAGCLSAARARGWQRRAAPDPPTMLCNEPGSQTGNGRQSATRASKAQQRHGCRPFRALPSPLQVKDTVYGLKDQWLGAASSLALPQGSQPAPEAMHEALLAAEAPPPALLAPLSEAQRAGLRAELAGKWRWSEGIEVGAECRLLLIAGAIRRPALQRHSCALCCASVPPGRHAPQPWLGRPPCPLLLPPPPVLSQNRSSLPPPCPHPTTPTLPTPSPSSPPTPQLLERYHASHGCGLVSQHRVLTWTGKLQAQDVLKGAPGWHRPAARAQGGRPARPARLLTLGRASPRQPAGAADGRAFSPRLAPSW